jgi:hypothetical protein
VSIELEHLEAGRFTVDLQPDTPNSIRDALDPRTSRGGHAFALTVVTPLHIPVGSISDSGLLERALYAGVTFGVGQDRQSVFGYGPLKLLGDDDGGVMWVASNFTDTGLTMSSALTDYVFNGAGAIDRGNGLFKGDFPADATTFSMRFRAGQTPRQNLAWLCARGPGGPYEHRVNPDCSVDTDTAANLFRSGEVLLVDEGGPDPFIDGLTADLSVDGIDVENFVTEQYVDWDGDGASMGSAVNSVPAGWDSPDGDPIQWRGYQRGTPKTRLRDPDDIDKTFAYINANQAAANLQAARMADQKANHRLNVTAEIDVHDPTRFIVPGDWAYVEDRRLGLYDTSNQVPAAPTCREYGDPVPAGVRVLPAPFGRVADRLLPLCRLRGQRLRHPTRDPRPFHPPAGTGPACDPPRQPATGPAGRLPEPRRLRCRSTLHQ